MSKKDATKEQLQEQLENQVPEQPTVGDEAKPTPEDEVKPTPEDEVKPTPEDEAKPESPQEEGDDADRELAAMLMNEHGVNEFHKCGSYWFKKKSDAEAWGEKIGAEVETFVRKEPVNS